MVNSIYTTSSCKQTSVILYDKYFSCLKGSRWPSMSSLKLYNKQMKEDEVCTQMPIPSLQREKLGYSFFSASATSEAWKGLLLSHASSYRPHKERHVSALTTTQHEQVKHKKNMFATEHPNRWWLNFQITNIVQLEEKSLNCSYDLPPFLTLYSRRCFSRIFRMELTWSNATIWSWTCVSHEFISVSCFSNSSAFFNASSSFWPSSSDLDATCSHASFNSSSCLWREAAVVGSLLDIIACKEFRIRS